MFAGFLGYKQGVNLQYLTLVDTPWQMHSSPSHATALDQWQREYPPC